MSRHFFLIALLSVLLPAGVSPARHADLVAPQPYVAALRDHPCAQRCITRGERRLTAARPVRGVYLTPGRRPSALTPFRPDSRLPALATPRTPLLRAPPSLA
ncbi:MAG TPA: hypothetical protein VGM37_12960 [Armatimonadota bacterium]